MRRRALLAGAAVLLVSACSSGKPAPATPQPADAFAKAKRLLDSTSGVTFSLTSTEVPPKVNGVTSASGQGAVSATEPKFKGTIGATVKGVTGTVQLIAIGAQTWMKFFTPDYNKVDLASLGAPNPATLFSPDKGLSSMLPATTGAVTGGTVRAGKEVLQTYTGKLPGAVVKRLLLLGPGSGEFDVTYGMAPSGELRTATVRGAFYAGAVSTYVLSLRGYGQNVAITSP